MTTNYGTTSTPPEIAQANAAAPTEELGVSGLISFFGNISTAYLPELYYPAAAKVYSEMQRRDPTLASLLNVIKLLSRTANWTVEPASSSDADQRAAGNLEENIADMSILLDDTIEDMLSAIPYGWAWSEIVYKRRLGKNPAGKGTDGLPLPQSKYDDGLVGWRKFAPRRQSSLYKWEFDASGGVQGMWQLPFLSVEKRKQAMPFIPIEKSVHFTAQRDMGSPEGLSIFEPLYEAWHFVKNLAILQGIGFERSFVGLPVFHYGTQAMPYEPTEKDKVLVRQTGQGLRMDEKAFLALPGQILFELVTTTNTNAVALLDTIRQYRVWMLQIAIADFLMLGTGGAGGAYSLGQDKSQLFLLGVDGWLDKIAHPDKLGVLNRYAVPRLFDLNAAAFPGMTDYPRIGHSSVQKPNIAGLGTYIAALGTGGFLTPDPTLEETLRSIADLPDAENPADPQNLPNPLDPNAQPNPNTLPKGTNGNGNGNKTPAHASGAQGGALKPRGVKFYELQFLEALDDYKAVSK